MSEGTEEVLPAEDAEKTTQPTAEDTEQFFDSQVEVTVDGEQQVLSVRDLTKSYELSAASHKRMQDASKLRKEAEEIQTRNQNLMEVQNFMSELKGKNELTQEDFAKLAKVGEVLGLPPEAVNDMVADVQKQLAEGQTPTRKPAAELPDIDKRLAPLEYEAARSREMRLKSIAEEIQETTKNNLTNDEVCGKLMKAGGEPAERMLKYTMRELQRRTNVEGAAWGPELLAEVVADTKALFGGWQPQKPPAADEPNGYPSLGAGGSGTSPSGKVQAPQKRPSASDQPKYQAFVTAALNKLMGGD